MIRSRRVRSVGVYRSRRTGRSRSRMASMVYRRRTYRRPIRVVRRRRVYRRR